MSIEFLQDLERAVERGAEVYACQTAVSGKWDISNSIDTIRKLAKRAAGTKRSGINIMRLTSAHQVTPETQILVATKIGSDSSKGAANISWSTVETKEAAETMRDVSCGPSPFFALQQEETVSP